jgi:hypothetical protein
MPVSPNTSSAIAPGEVDMSNFAVTVTEAMHLRINSGALPLARLLQVVAGTLAGADLPSTDLASLVT